MEDKVEIIDSNSVYCLFGNGILFRLLSGSPVLDTRWIARYRHAVVFEQKEILHYI